MSTDRYRQVFRSLLARFQRLDPRPPRVEHVSTGRGEVLRARRIRPIYIGQNECPVHDGQILTGVQLRSCADRNLSNQLDGSTLYRVEVDALDPWLVTLVPVGIAMVHDYWDR